MSEKKKRPLAGGRFPSRSETERMRPTAERTPSPAPDEDAGEERKPSSTRRFVSENLWRTASAESGRGAKTRTAVTEAKPVAPRGEEKPGAKPLGAKEKILRALKKLHPME